MDSSNDGLRQLRQCLATVLDPASTADGRRAAEVWLAQQQDPGVLPALLQLAAGHSGSSGNSELPAVRQLACWALARQKLPSLWAGLPDGDRQALLAEVIACLVREPTATQPSQHHHQQQHGVSSSGVGKALAELAASVAELQTGGGIGGGGGGGGSNGGSGDGVWPELLQYLAAAAATDGSAPPAQRALAMTLLVALLDRPAAVASLLHPFWPQLLALPAALLADREAAVVSRALEAAVRLAASSRAVEGGLAACKWSAEAAFAAAARRASIMVCSARLG